jgi:uncharacterized iron-regulated membrane protein
MVAPLLLTVVTGVGFQLAIATGQTRAFIWLMEFHRGHFGPINLEMVYPYLNGLGLLVMVVTGILMWLKQRPNQRRVQS